MATDLTQLMAEDTADDTQFITVDSPSTDLPTSQDPDGKYCIVCGTDVSDLYKRRMKEYRCADHKKNASASSLGTGTRRSSSKDVEGAVAALDSWYSLLTLGLFAAGAHKSSSAMAESMEDLKAKNETYLSQSPALAKKIADMGKTSAMYGFFSAQAMVLGPVVILATAELMEKWGKSKNTDPEDFDASLPGTVGGFPIG
jgi:hypothetical protein